jgi:hypothetical protein
MKNQLGYTLFELIVCVVALLGIGGWIANIVKLIHSDFATITGMLIGRIAGIFVPPLGAVLGFF